ncbi:MAG: hydroxymethylbilane synthase [Methylobacteriaceae bacterium]|nr:hydroxymethylbilane synthase [Methylobacteriaceae bacterium]
MGSGSLRPGGGERLARAGRLAYRRRDPARQPGRKEPRALSRTDRLVLGTRRSPLAMAQAREAAARLSAALGWEPDRVELAPTETTGDLIRDRPLSEAGGKGLFTKELDEALLSGRTDFAVHSAKDLPTALPPGLAVAGCLPREDVRDVLVSPLADSVAGLPHGTVVGTASLRRGAIMLRTRPDLQVVNFRGSVETRLAKLGRGEVGATILALAGLKRLGLAEKGTAILSIDEMLPAVGQGAIAIVTRAEDRRVRDAIDLVDHRETHQALAAERAFLAVLDGSCRTPIAGHATIRDGTLSFRGLVVAPDGSLAVEVAGHGPVADAERIGREAGQDLRARLPGGVLAA